MTISLSFASISRFNTHAILLGKYSSFTTTGIPRENSSERMAFLNEFEINAANGAMLEHAIIILRRVCPIVKVDNLIAYLIANSIL